MRRPNLVIARAGDTSLHPQWLTSPQRSWDLMVSYYGNHPERYRGQYDLLHCYLGSKWLATHDLMQRHGDLVDSYEYVWLADDDLLITSQAIDEFFACCRELQLTVAQPALTPESHFTWDITRQRPDLEARITDFVEIMAPCFRGDVFRLFSDTFTEASSGFGYEFLWYHLARQHGIDRFGIVDRTPMHHWRAVGFRSLGQLADPREEERQLFERFGVRPWNPAVLSEIPRAQHRLLGQGR